MWYFIVMEGYDLRHYMSRTGKYLLTCFSVLLLQGCSTLSYYHQAISGQSELLQKRIPITAALADKNLDAQVRQKLLIVQEARVFAVKELGLPDNKSYHDYADLKRPYVMWSVFVTPAFSLKPKRWCYPVVGCITYRNYFSQSDAQAYADKMQAQGYDVYVTGVPAYSTIGWFDDPVTNTMMHWQDYDLVGTLFHELAHQKFYIKNDTMFNESLARTIEHEGLRRWMGSRLRDDVHKKYLLEDQREAEFVRIVLDARKELELLYAKKDVAEKTLPAKLDIFRSLRREYIQLRKQWKGYEAYDNWMFSGVNNAKVQAIATYYDYVPAFKRMLAEQGDDLSLFYRHIEKLMNMNKKERDKFLSGMKKP